MVVRIIHMIGSLDIGGSQTMIMNIYRTIDRNRIQFDFIVDHSDQLYFKEEIEKESPSFVRPELYEKALDFILKQNNEYKETYTHKFVHDRPDETHVENLRYNDPYSHEC